MNEELLKLKREVNELMEYKKARESQQLFYPLDKESKDILQRDFIMSTGETYPLILTELLSFGLEVYIDGFKKVLYASNPLSAFTADAGTNVCTYTGGAHSLVNGNQVALATSGVLPAGLDTTTEYYIISATTSTFKLSLTAGGSEIDITDAGTGTHYYGQI